MAEIVFDITSGESEIARKRRDAARLVREEFEEIAPEGHEPYVVSGFSQTEIVRWSPASDPTFCLIA